MHHSLLIESIERHVMLSEEERKFLVSIFTLRKIKKGQFLIHQGAVSRHLSFVKNGNIITYFIDANGYEHIIQLGVDGWWVGDLQSYVFQQPARLNVQAIMDTEILEVSYENVQQLYLEIPQFERYQRIVTQHAYIAFQERVLQNLSMNAEDRYLAFVEKYPKIEPQLQQKYVASYLGITPEFLSKIKKRIAKRSNKQVSKSGR